MKLFRTNNIGTVKECQSYFSFQLPSEMLKQKGQSVSTLSLRARQLHGCNLMFLSVTNKNGTIGRAHVPPTKVFPRLAVNKTILKPRLAAATGA